MEWRLTSTMDSGLTWPGQVRRDGRSVPELHEPCTGLHVAFKRKGTTTSISFPSGQSWQAGMSR